MHETTIVVPSLIQHVGVIELLFFQKSISIIKW
jgi:hypothetical protein